MNVTINLSENHIRDNAKPSVIRADLIKVIRLYKELEEQLSIPRVSESTFIDAFENAVHGDMWQHEDDHDYSKGMEQMSDAKIKEVAKTLYDGLYSR